MYTRYHFEEAEASFTRSYEAIAVFYETFVLHPHWVFDMGLGIDAGIGFQYTNDEDTSGKVFVAEAGCSYEHRFKDLLGVGARIGMRVELNDDGLDDASATTLHPTLSAFGDVFLFDWLSVRPALVIGYRSMEHGAVKVTGLTLGVEIGLNVWVR